MNRTLALATASLLLALAACGGSENGKGGDGDEKFDAGEAGLETTPDGDGGPGEYLYVDEYGARITVDLSNSDYGNDLTDEADAVRELQGEDAVDWCRVEIDNREGAEEFTLFEMSVVTKDGDTYDAVEGSENVPELPDMDGEDGLYNRNVDAGNAFIDAYPQGLPGSIGETQVTFPGLDLDRIRFVYINSEQATKIS